MEQPPEDVRQGRLKAFPLSWLTTGRRLLLVGGCQDRLCRLAHAVKFDWASIHAVVPDGEPALCEACRADRRVRVSYTLPTEEDVREADLVIESTLNTALATQVARWCKAGRIPLNAMDKTEHCDLYYNSLVFREPLVLAVSSGGESPALTAALRRWLEARVGPGWGHAARLLAELREGMPHSPERSELLKRLAESPTFLKSIEDNDIAGMKAAIREEHDRHRT